MIHINWPHWLVLLKVKALTGVSHLKLLWNVWNIQTFILVSFGLQIILTFIAPFRKKTGNSIVMIVVWLAYLLADYVAIQGVGLISNYHTKSGSKTHPDLLAFWAPFLLVHLGGPDSITALALQDNELWTRIALHLVTYGFATARVFFQSLPSNTLAVPTIFMFTAGILKFLERTMSLYSARLTKFKSSIRAQPDPGLDYARHMQVYDSYLRSGVPVTLYTPYSRLVTDKDKSLFSAYQSRARQPVDVDVEGINRNVEGAEKNKGSWGLFNYLRCCCCFGFTASNGSVRRRNVKLVTEAFEFYDKFKVLYVDLNLTSQDRLKSRAYFLDDNLTEAEAFSVLEMELNFTYEVFFTKMILIHQTSWFWIRTASSIMEVASVIIWVLLIEKSAFQRFDIWITYTLLVGAIITDWIAYFMVKTSDWMIATRSKQSDRWALVYSKLLLARTRTWGAFWGPEGTPFMPWIRRILFRRWSETVPQFSLISYCANKWGTGATILIKLLPPVEDKLVGLTYVSNKWFHDELRDFIFREINRKAEMAENPEDAEMIYESRGIWVLRSLAGLVSFPFQFYHWTNDVEYDESLLLWHIATELLYQEDELIDDSSSLSEKESKFRRISKTLADYMMYLLNRQPEMMLSVTGMSEVRYRDTCAEASILVDRTLQKQGYVTKEVRIKGFCKMLMDVSSYADPIDINGNMSKSVLFKAVQLAKSLTKFREREKVVGMWELIAKVWMELVSYAAAHTKASAHAAQLKQGGELLTLLWLLMVHMGLGRQFTTANVSKSMLSIGK